MYTGYSEITPTNFELAALYEGKYDLTQLNLLENQYLIVKDQDEKVLDTFIFKDKVLEKVNYSKINNKYERNIKGLDVYQNCTINLLQDRNIPVKLIRGVYGSGKDYLMFNQALSLIEDGVFDKIIFTRPNVTLSNVPEIGYLPNGLDEKLGWTLAPLYDKIGGEEGLRYLTERNQFEMAPLLFIRGRSFENCLVYVTEAQNMDDSTIKVLLSRIGKNSELWLNGDNHQTDKRIFDQNNGLTLMLERLKGNHLFGYVYLPITHRSEVANLSNLLD